MFVYSLVSRLSDSEILSQDLTKEETAPSIASILKR